MATERDPEDLLTRDDGTVYRNPRTGVVWVLATGADHRRCLIAAWSPEGHGVGVVTHEGDAMRMTRAMDIIGRLPGTPAATTGDAAIHDRPRAGAHLLRAEADPEGVAAFADQVHARHAHAAADGATDRHARAAAAQLAERGGTGRTDDHVPAASAPATEPHPRSLRTPEQRAAVSAQGIDRADWQRP